MAGSDDALPDPPSIALGPLGHRINRVLGTARLAVDLACRQARESDRAALLAGPLADVAACIDEAGRVTKTLQRLAGAERERVELGDWNDLLSDVVAALPERGSIELGVAARPLPVRCAPRALRALLGLLLHSLAAQSDRLTLAAGRSATHARLHVRAHGPTWSAAERERRSDPFATDAAIAGLDDLALFCARSELQRLGGRVEWTPDAEGNALMLELPLANH